VKKIKFGGFGLSVIILVLGCNIQKKELPQLGVLPEFNLVNQDNKPIRLKDYQGKIWVANFIFTSCAGTCPLLTQRMKKVQRALRQMDQQKGTLPVRIVSFSVDPERDTPERLADYAKGHGADKQYWAFLTGPVDAITDTIVKGFKISMGKVPLEGKDDKVNPGEKFDVVHGEKFVLIDEKGQIRGYYDSQSSGVKTLISDLKILLKNQS